MAVDVSVPVDRTIVSRAYCVQQSLVCFLFSRDAYSEYNFCVSSRGFGSISIAFHVKPVLVLSTVDTDLDGLSGLISAVTACPVDAPVSLSSHSELGSSACSSIFRPAEQHLCPGCHGECLVVATATRGLSRTADKSSERNALFNYFVRSRISEQCCMEILVVAKRAFHLTENGPISTN